MLMLFHFDLSIVGTIGIILLIGIVKKNGIMMVDFAIHAERNEHLEPQAAIRKACLLRFRPIMMTTMAAILGALPLMLGRGTGSELRQPLGYTMVGGLVLSQMLTLFTTPVIYLYLDRLVVRWARKHPHQDALARHRDDGRHAGGAMKILVVEDNERVARFVTAACARPGTPCEHAAQRPRRPVPRRQRAVRRHRHGPHAAGQHRRPGDHRGAAQGRQPHARS